VASRAATGRAIAIIVGLVLALVAAFLLWRYVNAADQRALEGAELVDVFVAVGGIPEGTTAQTAVSNRLIELDQLPSDNRPDTAITTLDEISGLAALAPIQDGAILQSGQFGDPTIADADFKLEEGQVAVSLQVGIPEGVSGFLDQGDTVGVIAHIDAQLANANVELGPDGSPVVSTAQPEVDTTTSKYLTAAEILAIGQRIISTDAEGNQAEGVETGGQVLVTLSVTPTDAERLVFANNEGIMHFTLLPEGEELGETPGTTYDTLFNQ